jgi:hypothetical protein
MVRCHGILLHHCFAVELLKPVDSRGSKNFGNFFMRRAYHAHACVGSGPH